MPPTYRELSAFRESADCDKARFTPDKKKCLTSSPFEARADSPLVHGEVAIDLLTRRVSAGGIEHDLTAREFTMLESFLWHLGQLGSREQLLLRVRALGYEPACDAVDSYILYLKQKLANDLIHTVRGMG